MMSRSSKRRLRFIGWLATVLCLASPALAQDASIQFTVTADPHDEAGVLLFESTEGPPTTLARAADFTADSIDVAVPFQSPPFEDGVIRLEWEDGSESSFPVFLSLGATGDTFLMLIHRRSEDTPTRNEVSRDCLQREPDTLSRAFEMFFTCRAHAFRLEEDGLGVARPEPAYRYALAGWMKANYRLYVDPFCRPGVNPGCTASNRVSPYGADPDLLSRMRQIVALDHWDAWLPFRVADARNFVDYVDQRWLQLVNLIPEVSREDAVLINERALAIVRETERNAFSITEDLLTQNMIAIATE